MGIFEREANFIKFMLTNPCARPWYVYVETFIPAFLELLFTVAILDINDIIRSHGQKIASEGGKKAGRGGRHTPRIAATGGKTPVERYMQKGLKTLLIVTQPLENIGYAWLLYSAVDEFFFDWQTLIEEAPFCTQPIESGPLSRSRGGGFIFIFPAGFPIIMTTLTQNRAGWVTGELFADVPQGHISYFFAATIGSPPGGITGVSIRLKIVDAFGTRYQATPEQDIPEHGLRDFVISDTFFVPTGGGAHVQWELVGPNVPVGIWCDKARCGFSRVA